MLASSVALVVAAAPAAWSQPSATHDVTSSPEHPRIVIKNFGFSGPTVARPGVTVRVVNRDAVAHTLTHGRRGTFDTGRIAPGGHATFVAPRRVGTYRFHCAIHPDMHGTLIVKRHG